MSARPKQNTILSGSIVRRLPEKRSPIHPGEMLLEEFLKPLGLTQRGFSRQLGISYGRLNEIINGRRPVSPELAIRLAIVLGMTTEFWLNLQQAWDLWHVLNGPRAKEISRLKPIPKMDRDQAKRLAKLGGSEPDLRSVPRRRKPLS